MKASIIGASGFVGKALVRHLLAAGHDTTSLDVVKRSPLGKGESFRTFDVRKDDLTFDPDTDAVFYLAQSGHYRDFPAYASDLFGVNTLGVIKAARAASEAGVRFFCYASAGNVYKPAFHPLKESHPLRRDEPYALSKLMAEEALALFCGRMGVVSTRLFAVFGPGQEQMLPIRLLNMIRNGEPLTLEPSPLALGNTEGVIISFCYVKDAVNCLVRLAQMALDGCTLPPAINVAGPEAVSIRKFSEALGKIIGKEPVFKVSGATRPQDFIADIDMLQSLVNLDFTPFSEAMTLAFGGRRK